MKRKLSTSKRATASAAPTRRLSSSFRDPAGYMYRDARGVLRRQITPVGLADFEAAETSGLYDVLIGEGILIEHKAGNKDAAGITLTPDEVAPITYPFEWSFSMLKDAALVTLAAQKRALEHGMTLKDATAYNVQFDVGHPVLIDTLSFEPYRAGEPWVAYGQFCRHFLAPLALMSYVDVRLGQLSRDYIDGVPLDLAAKLLPRTSKLRFGILMHLFWHSRAQEGKARDHRAPQTHVSKTSLLAIIDSLERLIRSLKPYNSRTEWRDYYQHTNYSESAAKAKLKLVGALTRQIPGLRSLLDLAGNDGHYSRDLAERGVQVLCADIDPFAVEFNYRFVRAHHETHMLPLLVDFVNPGGAMGWANEERGLIEDRFRVDAVLALAIIHHLAISNNLSFMMIAEYMRRFGKYLVIEFVPKEDSQVQKLLSTRKDIFQNYNQASFEQAFGQFYNLVQKKSIPGTKRTLYLYRRKGGGDE